MGGNIQKMGINTVLSGKQHRHFAKIESTKRQSCWSTRPREETVLLCPFSCLLLSSAKALVLRLIAFLHGKAFLVISKEQKTMTIFLILLLFSLKALPTHGTRRGHYKHENSFVAFLSLIGFVYSLRPFDLVLVQFKCGCVRADRILETVYSLI